MLQFSCSLLVITLSALTLHTENNACFWKSWVALKRAGFNAEDAQSDVLGLHTRSESHLPLVDCVVDDVLRQT